MFALDTSTLSCWLRGEGQVAERVRSVRPADVALPSVVVYEINFGLRRAGRQRQLGEFARLVQLVQVLDFDVEAADHAARIRTELEESGTPIGPHDLLIAATARRHRRTLVTHNTREFKRVSGLALDDWY